MRCRRARSLKLESRGQEVDQRPRKFGERVIGVAGEVCWPGELCQISGLSVRRCPEENAGHQRDLEPRAWRVQASQRQRGRPWSGKGRVCRAGAHISDSGSRMFCCFPTRGRHPDKIAECPQGLPGRRRTNYRRKYDIRGTGRVGCDSNSQRGA